MDDIERDLSALAVAHKGPAPRRPRAEAGCAVSGLKV